MSEKQPSDVAVRRRATDPRHSFLVQAPAGSGKTELLTDRILALLGTVNRPEDIVAITFTRKAAAEMHERVLEKLTNGLCDIPPALEHERRSWEMARQALERDREFQWNILQHPARLTIRTIDSFCASLVRAMPWLSSMGGLPAIAEDARAHYLAAASATIEMAGACPEVKQLLMHMDLDVGATREALADMLSQRDQWLPHLERTDDYGALQDNLLEAIEQDLARLLAVMPACWAERLAPLACFAAANLQQTNPASPIVALLDWDGTPLGTVASERNRWQGLASLLLTDNGQVRKAVTVAQGFPPGAEGQQAKARMQQWLEENRPRGGAGDQLPEWLVRLASTTTLPDYQFTSEQWKIIQAQMQCLKLATGQLTLQFIQAGEVDFIEIARRADVALGRSDDPSELLLRLDATIQHLLVDEFQDTSLSQIALLTKLTAGWQSGDGRTLFFVGDPMQSIYRFRKADVSLFIKVRDQGLAGLPLTCLQLTDNFRSQRKIVEWVNATFKPMFPAADDPAVGAISYAHSMAFKSDTVQNAVQYHSFLPGDQQTSEQRVVELVRQALENFNQPEHKHPVAILVRARAHLLELTQLLQREGIACRAVELVPLHQRPFVVDLVQLARALTHPADRLAWISVLRSPYCGLKLVSLHALFGRDHRTVPEILFSMLKVSDATGVCPAQSLLDAQEFARLQGVAPILLEALMQDDVQPFAARLESVWRALSGPELAQSAADLQDAESLFVLIEHLAPYGALQIDQLQERLTKLYASPDQHDRAVEIMTMHKCKGLQFETVILYGLQRSPASDRTPLLRFEQVGSRLLLGPIKARANKEQDPIAKYLAQREKRRGEFEIDRLLYVAATRAKQVLHLVADLSLATKELAVAEPAKASLLERLWPGWPKGSLGAVTARPVDQSAAKPYYRGGELIRRADFLTRAPTVASVDLDPLLPSRSERPAFNSAFVWPAVKTYDRILGTLIHAWLDHLGRQGLTQWSEDKLQKQRKRIERQCVRAGVPAAEAACAAQEVLENLGAMLRHERGQKLLAQMGARREWALLDETGKISVLDLALQDEQGWLVVDYKTGRPSEGEAPDAFGARMMTRYANQLQSYCDRVSRLDGRPARAALYFPLNDLWVEYEP